MKLRHLFLILLLFSSLVVKSQVMWMLIFGDKFSNDKIQSGANISFSLVNFSGLGETKYLPTWALGGFTEITLTDHWKLQPEFVFKSPTGATNVGSYYQIPGIQDSLFFERKDYLEIVSFTLPIYIKYKTKYLGLGVGPQFGLAYTAKLIQKGETLYGDNLIVKHDFKPYMHNFDFGITGMFEFYLSPEKDAASMRIGIRYYYGITQTLKRYPGVHNSVFMFTLGVPIISHKKPTKRPAETTDR